MAQTIKSLSAMMSDVHVEGVQSDRLKKGYYGYNMVYVVMDGKIQVVFRVDYQKDNDENAVSNTIQSITLDIGIVRMINTKCHLMAVRLLGL